MNATSTTDPRIIDRQRAAELADALAAHLRANGHPGAHVVPLDPEGRNDADSIAVSLQRAECNLRPWHPEAGIHLRINGWGLDTGRVRVSGYWPSYRDRQGYIQTIAPSQIGYTAPEATANLTRPMPALVADICRRFLPPYLAAWEACKGRCMNYGDRAAADREAFRELQHALGIAPVRELAEYPSSRALLHPKGSRLCPEIVFDGAESITFSVTLHTWRDAVALAELVADRHPELAEEGGEA